VVRVLMRPRRSGSMKLLMPLLASVLNGSGRRLSLLTPTKE
jgi:hypothetical protein